MVQGSDSTTDDEIVEKGVAAADAVFESKLYVVGREQFTPYMRMVMLQSIDLHWREQNVARGARGRFTAAHVRTQSKRGAAPEAPPFHSPYER